MSTDQRATGIPAVGDLPWGMHVCVFYETQGDLLDVVVPYFAAGLAAGERCAWVPSEPSIEKEATDALRKRVSDFDARLERGDLLLLRPEEFYVTEGRVEIDAIMAKWGAWDTEVRADGMPGLRVSGNVSWLDRRDWTAFAEYERTLHQFLVGRRILTLCTYPLSGYKAADVLDVARTHHSVVARRKGEWEILEQPALAKTKTELHRLNTLLEERVRIRTGELAATNQELRREIDERKRVEAELRRSETYLEQGQRLSHTGSCAIDPATGQYTYWSPELFRIFGREPSPTPPTMEEVLAQAHPSDRATVQREIAAMIREGRPGDFEFRIHRPDGTLRHLHTFALPLTDAAGRVVEIVGTDIDLTDIKRAEARLSRARRRARERLLEARFTATLEERTRLAREIHDSLLQGATGIALQLRALLPRFGGAPASTVDNARHIVELAEETIRDARRAVWDIRSPVLLEKGLPDALTEAANLAAGDIPVDVAVRGTPRRLPATVEDTLFRIGQEAVANAAKHADPARVFVALEYRSRSVRLTVCDDGRGFHVEPVVRAGGGHWGLLGMHERAERIGASLAIRSTMGKGTTVEVRAR